MLKSGDLVDCIVSLPGQLFYSTQIPASLWFISRNKKNSPRHNRYILVDNWAEWCEACKKMDVTTFKDPKLMTLFEQSGQWIFLKLDLTETNAANEAILSKYEIQGLPTLVLLNPQANLDQRENIAGYVDAPTLLEKMQEFSAREKQR